MRPITTTVPKPLVEVGGKALIDHALDRLAEAKVETAVVNVHHLADQVVAHVSGRKRPKVVISDERGQLMETGGGVVRALPQLGPGPFFLLNSDSFWTEGKTPNLAKLARTWDGERMAALLMLAPTEAAIGYEGPGDFLMDAGGRLSPRASRTAPFVYTGVAIVDPAAMFGDAPEGPFPLSVLIERISREGRLFGVRMEGAWFHVGTPAAIDEAERVLVSSAA
jgi:MurNAc alpha-1-phosphate uridylyltransferase